jgi:hypothetical protein
VADVTQAEKVELVFAGKFSENKQIPILLNKLIGGGTDFWKNVKYEKNGAVEYWTDEFNGIFFALSRDVFVATKNDADRKVVIERMAKDDGLEVKPNDRLMYAYVGGKFFNSGDSFLSKVLQSMKGSFAEIVIAQDGIRSFYKANVDTKGEGFNILVPNPDYKLSLVDKVNSKGLFFYTESSSFMNVLLADFVDDKAVAPASIDSPDSLKNYIGSFIKKVKFILDSPHAISISDKDNYVPAIALYFQLKDEDLDKAKSLLVDFDGYVDQVIMEVNKVIPAIEGQPSPFKKDLVVVNGGALHKVYMDWAAVPQELITEWSTKSEINVTSVKNEFYYGLMGDNVFVVAWYPDFPDSYGKDVISQNVVYQEAFKQIGGGFDRSVLYMDTKSLLGFADKFMKMAVTMNTEEGMAKDIALGYVKLAEKVIGTVKYYIATSGYKEGQLSAESFVKVEKLEEEKVEVK